ncbi:MAG: pyruvate kinase [Desulfurococcales archaeon]|nr:pyruvate kinase [Desulfurococcales archaeon]
MKTIVTMGPSTGSKEVVKALAEAGTDGFRINFSHGSMEIWSEYVNYITDAERELGKPLSLIGDLQGPNPRIGDILIGEINFVPGEKIHFTFGTMSKNKEIPVPYREFFDIVKPGDTILMSDGAISLKILSVDEGEAVAAAETSGTISSRKSFAIKGKKLYLPYVTPHDIECLKFAASYNFSHIMASIVENQGNIAELRGITSKLFRDPPEIYSKIETEEGYNNLEKIINVSDGIVVARGDLGSHFPMEILPKVQKEIIRNSRKLGKPVVVATQLLSSMIESTTPTRSEVVDIYNAVLEGADALMLTNETAVGKHPVEAVSWLKKISKEAITIYKEDKALLEDSLFHRFAFGLTSLSESLRAKILVYTKSGLTGKIISAYRPEKGFFAGVPNVNIARKLALYWGASPAVIEAQSYDDGLLKLRELLRTDGIIKNGDILIETFRFKEGEMHSLRIFYVR